MWLGMRKHVAVLMGGWSAEREISLRSGQACAEALKRVGYRVTAIDAGRDVASALTAAAPDVALNVLPEIGDFIALGPSLRRSPETCGLPGHRHRRRP